MYPPALRKPFRIFSPAARTIPVSEHGREKSSKKMTGRSNCRNRGEMVGMVQQIHAANAFHVHIYWIFVSLFHPVMKGGVFPQHRHLFHPHRSHMWDWLKWERQWLAEGQPVIFIGEWRFKPGTNTLNLTPHWLSHQFLFVCLGTHFLPCNIYFCSDNTWIFVPFLLLTGPQRRQRYLSCKSFLVYILKAKS